LEEELEPWPVELSSTDSPEGTILLTFRHNLLLVNAFAMAAGLILYVPRMEIFFAARLLQGICAGFFSSIAPLIMKELSPNEISGTLTSFNQIFIAFGVFFAFVFALIMTVTFNDPLG
jgi:MFS family permease